MTPILDGTVALVTGASSGIGVTTALELARHGAAVALAARRATGWTSWRPGSAPTAGSPWCSRRTSPARTRRRPRSSGPWPSSARWIP